MAKQNKLDEILKKRNPLEERQVITPVDVLETGLPHPTDEPIERTVKPNTPTERKSRTPKRNKRTEQTNAMTERPNRTVFDELQTGTLGTKRATERYSFEIYTDQKGSIEELQHLYKKRFGKTLSASRLIREALEEYLTKALQNFKEEEETE